MKCKTCKKIIIYQYFWKSESMPRRSGGDNWPKFQREDPGVTTSCLQSSYTKSLLCGVGVGGCECEWTAGHGESDMSDDWNGQWTAGTRDRHCRLEHQLDVRRRLVHLDVVLQTTVLYHTNTFLGVVLAVTAMVNHIWKQWRPSCCCNHVFRKMAKWWAVVTDNLCTTWSA